MTKLVIVDLDGTLWDGILLEDGFDALRLRPEMVEALRRYDRAGVVLSIASRGVEEDARAALRDFGVEDLFVFAQISFGPKSAAVDAILRAVRLGSDATIFVDDAAAEREEVRRAFPDITVCGPDEFVAAAANIDAEAARPDTGVVSRRAFYRKEETRQKAERDFSGTFREFLAESGIAVRVGRASQQSAPRITEIAARTNQINFSANRYREEEVLDLLDSHAHRLYVASAEDCYGDYGMVGFGCLRFDTDGTATIQDLMLSCRIQGRGVESALIAVFAREAARTGARRLIGVYQPTRRNGHIASVYPGLGFAPEDAGSVDAPQRFALDLRGALPAPPAHLRIIVSDAVAADRDHGIPLVVDIVRQAIAAGHLRGQVLDVGAGWDGVLGEGCDEWFEVSGIRHVRLDQQRYPKTDIIADAQDMREIADGAFDAAVCLEVLEHCTDPFALARELIRVVRRGGVSIVSAPMNYPIHDTPGDYWRFTPDGLKRLFPGAEILAEHVEGDNEHPIRTVLVLRRPTD